MKFKMIAFILMILFGLWIVYFIYETDKPIIMENIVLPEKENQIIPLDENKMPFNAKM